ncbi:MAG: AAA family ATPase [Candidatus Binataceae bacterium]
MSALAKRNEGRKGAVLRVHAVAETAAQRQEVRVALAVLGDPAIELTDSAPDTNDRSYGDAPPDVTMVAFNGVEESSLKYVQAHAALSPRPVVFALLHERSPELMRRVLRAGADELLFLPLDPGDVTRALLKISEARRRDENHGGGSIVSLVSLVGGVGVTSLAANLAFALRYAQDKRVALVDLDLQTSGLAVFMNLEPERTIMALAEGDRRIDSIRLEAALSKHTSGVYMLAAPKRIEDSELVPDVIVGAVLDLMRQLFDFVVVDCGTHVDANSVAAWERSQYLFYVLDQSIGAARCAWRFVDLCGRLGLGGIEPTFLLSRYVANHPISENQISHTLGQPIFAKIPRDEKTLERVQLSAQDLWQVAPNSVLAKSVEELAMKIANPAEAAAQETESSLVSRLLFAIGARA